MIPLYYDRSGNPIDSITWATIREHQNPQVTITRFSDGSWLSTVWLGLDHRFGGDGPPIIFESMYFPQADSYQNEDCRRYCTESEAILGHAEMIQEIIT